MTDGVWVKVAGDWKFVYPPADPLNDAVGGTVTGYFVGTKYFRVHTLKNGESLTVLKNPQPFSVLMIAGGGGGADSSQQVNRGGGGGAGGLKELQMTLPVGALPVVVGGGGSPNANGGDTTFNGVTVHGGGHGGRVGQNGANGGSGGGAGKTTDGNGGTWHTPGKGIPGEGFDGFSTYGGGAGGPATAHTPAGHGPPHRSSITGTPVDYGYGGLEYTDTVHTTPGSGGNSGSDSGGPGPTGGRAGTVIVAYEAVFATSGSNWIPTRFADPAGTPPWDVTPAGWAAEFDAADGGVTYHYHVFLGSGSFTAGKDMTVDVLVVGGGANSVGGPGHADDVGRGGVVTIQTGIALTRGQSVPVTVGAGGHQSPGAGGTHSNESGGASSFGTFATAAGGSGRGSSPNPGTISTFTGASLEYGRGGMFRTQIRDWIRYMPGAGGLADRSGAQWNGYGIDGIVIVRYRK